MGYKYKYFLHSFFILPGYVGSRFSIMEKHGFRISPINNYSFPLPFYFSSLTFMYCFWPSILLIDPELRVFIWYWSVFCQMYAWKIFLVLYAHHIWVPGSPTLTDQVASGMSPAPKFTGLLEKTIKLFMSPAPEWRVEKVCWVAWYYKRGCVIAIGRTFEKHTFT